MSKPYKTTVFIIRESVTGQLIRFGTKCGWCSASAAKNAFNLHMKSYFGKDWSEGKGLFDSQDQFTLEELK